MHQDLGKEQFHFISKLHNIVRSSPQASDYRDLAFYIRFDLRHTGPD
jgi:hypothetical protein